MHTVICTSCYENASYLTLMVNLEQIVLLCGVLPSVSMVHNVMLSNVRICHDSWYVFATHFVQNIIENWP